VLAADGLIFRGGRSPDSLRGPECISGVPGVTGAAAEPAITSNYRKSDHQQRNPFRIAPGHSLHDLIFECHAFGVIFLERCFSGVDVCEHLEMMGWPTWYLVST
jgi:hypothetical protein